MLGDKIGTEKLSSIVFNPKDSLILLQLLYSRN